MKNIIMQETLTGASNNPSMGDAGGPVQPYKLRRGKAAAKRNYPVGSVLVSRRWEGTQFLAPPIHLLLSP